MNQFAFNLSHDALVQVIGGWSRGTDTLTNKFGAKEREISSPYPRTDWSRQRLSSKLRRQVLNDQFGAGTKNDSSFNVVLKFTDIPRPIVLAQEAHCITVYTPHRPSILLGITFEKVDDKWFDIFATLAQRGQVDWHDVQAVIKIFAKSIGFDFINEIAIGSSDDSGVDLLGIVVAYPFEFSFLQDAKKFDLELGRSAVDLVEKNAAGVCCLKPASAIINSSGKRTFDVTEQLAFEQAFRQSATINSNIWSS